VNKKITEPGVHRRHQFVDRDILYLCTRDIWHELSRKSISTWDSALSYMVLIMALRVMRGE